MYLSNHVGGKNEMTYQIGRTPLAPRLSILHEVQTALDGYKSLTSASRLLLFLQPDCVLAPADLSDLRFVKNLGTTASLPGDFSP